MRPRSHTSYWFLSVILSCFAATTFSQSPPVSFRAPRAYDVGTNPYSVVVGDFNGDRKQDLAVANWASSTVSVLLGNGDGSFQAAVSYAVGSHPRSVTMGDFNGDGKLDLAVANEFSNNVSVLLGNGDGSFQVPVNFAAGSSPFSVTVGDFNGDGKLDLATTSYSGVAVLLGNGDGSFQSAVHFATGGGPFSVAVRDFNSDGKLDLAVANDYSGNVSVLLGNGDGTFQAAVSYAAGYGPRSVTVGDFNGDGKSDLAVANWGGGNVSVLLGNGDGTFQTAVNYPVGTYSISVTVGDFNGDGKPDLAVASFQGDSKWNNLSVLLGNGDGTFQPAVNYPGGLASISVTVGDFNGDGKADVALANYQGNNVSVLLGNGDGTFQEAPSYAAGICPASVTMGDFNGDGKLDIAVANGGNPFAGVVGSVSVLLGNGDGTFQPALNYEAGLGPISVAIADFNGDGKLDMAVVNNGSANVSVLLGNGDGTFQAAVNYAVGIGPFSLTVGDFNGDSKLDLAVTNIQGDNVSVLLGNGDGTFRPAMNYSVGKSPTSVSVGDFNGDGKLDLAVANASCNNPPYCSSQGTISLLLGNGDGTFRAAVNYAVGSDPFSVTVGDFNGDGKLDLAVANAGNPDAFIAGSVSVLLGNGDGTFQPAVNYAAGFYPVAVTAGDLNGDRKLDLVVAGGGGVSVLLGNGDGTFQAAVSFMAGIYPVSVSVGDFNGDGQPDLAVANYYSNNVSVLLNTTKERSRTTITALSPNPSVAGQPVTVSFTVTPVGPGFGGTPSGNVTVTDGAGDSCTATVAAGNCAIMLPTAGTKMLTASYAGDINFLQSTSAGVAQGVTDFAISARPTSLSIKAGQAGISKVSLAPLSGFAGAVALSCGGAPPGSTCAIHPDSLTLTGSRTASGTVTVQTSKSTPKGSYTLTLTGTSGSGIPATGGLTHGANVSLTVN
jgi:VCBS repeat protein/Big-like domain-containing protein/FG-GAP repeat protein